MHTLCHMMMEILSSGDTTQSLGLKHKNVSFSIFVHWYHICLDPHSMDDHWKQWYYRRWKNGKDSLLRPDIGKEEYSDYGFVAKIHNPSYIISVRSFQNLSGQMLMITFDGRQ